MGSIGWGRSKSCKYDVVFIFSGYFMSIFQVDLIIYKKSTQKMNDTAQAHETKSTCSTVL